MPRKLFDSERDMPCYTCGAYAGKPCLTKKSRLTDYPHANRHMAWCMKRNYHRDETSHGESRNDYIAYDATRN